MDGIVGYLKRQRRRIEDLQARRGDGHTLSLSRYQLRAQLTELIEGHASGTCLDIGAGHAPFRSQLISLASRVICMDVEDRAGQVDVIADIQSMPQIDSGTIDTILCSQVLEHLPRPWDAVSEMSRVLKEGGKLILSAPHLSAIHEAPHDYYRYTEFGLRSLLLNGDLEILQLTKAGGVISFLSHYASLLGLTMTAPLPIVSRLSRSINYWLMVRALQPVDNLLGMPGLFPCNYVLVAMKRSPPPGATLSRP